MITDIIYIMITNIYIMRTKNDVRTNIYHLFWTV